MEKTWLKSSNGERVGDLDLEIKGLALMLASNASSYITGAVIPIDGGKTVGGE